MSLEVHINLCSHRVQDSRERIYRVGKALESCLCQLTLGSLWSLSSEGFNLHEVDGMLFLFCWKVEVQLHHHRLTICVLFEATLPHNLLTLNSIAFAERTVILCCLCSSTKSSLSFKSSVAPSIIPRVILPLCMKICILDACH